MKKDNQLHVHHIHFRSQGGTDAPDNLITLCKTCHDTLHTSAYPEKESFGYETKYKRESLDLKNEHYIDAICAGFTEKQMIELPKVPYKTACIA